jgi:signal transduction histidine kinase
MDSGATLASTQTFLTQGQALGANGGLLWMWIVADLLLAAVAVGASLLLIRAARRRPDLPLNQLAIPLGIFGATGALALLCHVWNVWHTQYGLEVALQILTAAAGLGTLISLFRALPALLALPSAAELQKARDSAAQAARELETFTASVSHDLRSPLSSIAGQAGLLEIALGEQVTDDQRRRLNRIQISVKQMSELIESLLMLSRISRANLHMENVDLSALAQDIARDLQQHDPQRRTQIEIQPGMTVLGDRKLLATLMSNLMSNAWKFTSLNETARIEVGAAPGSELITLHVRDNGLGFDMSQEEKLFKPFQKLHGNELSGSGIGLAMVKRITERHGGRAWAQGKINEGSQFYCSLPAHPRSAQQQSSH